MSLIIKLSINSRTTKNIDVVKFGCAGTGSLGNAVTQKVDLSVFDLHSALLLCGCVSGLAGGQLARPALHYHYYICFSIGCQ